MKRTSTWAVFLALLVVATLMGCEGANSPTAPLVTAGTGSGSANVNAGSTLDLKAAPRASCWGQASAVFARMGEMGEHSSQQGQPRLGLRNLARALAEDGVIPDDSMASLGQFVANVLGLSIEACM